MVRAIDERARNEAEGSNAAYAFSVIQENIELARDRSQPICQDTGSILFYVDHPIGYDVLEFKEAARWAVKAATEKGYLRQNSVDSLTGANSGTNLGPGAPVFHFHAVEGDKVEVRMMLKGGGSENVGAQYSLPDARLGAGRDYKGVKKCILDAVFQAQGKGCAPGTLGVSIGGDRATSYEFSKEQFLRPLGTPSDDADAAQMEREIMQEANGLNIGPMGFGGKTTLLGCHIGKMNRHPASFFVAVSYMCWAYRRRGFALNPDATIAEWLY